MVSIVNEMNQRWLNYADAAKYCGLSPSTLRRLVEARKLQVYRPSERKVLLDRVELDSLILASATAARFDIRLRTSEQGIETGRSYPGQWLRGTAARHSSSFLGATGEAPRSRRGPPVTCSVSAHLEQQHGVRFPLVGGGFAPFLSSRVLLHPQG